MLRSVLAKVMWVGRATVFLVGLAVILALLFGVASTALGANGKPLILGKAANTASKITGLVKSGAGPALRLKVGSGPPLAVNSSEKVDNLNADKVDGRDAPLWAVVTSSGTLARANGATSSSKLGTGWYGVVFDKNVSQCGYTATLGGARGFFAADGSAEVTASNNDAMVWVQTEDLSGNPSDRDFYLTVNC